MSSRIGLLVLITLLLLGCTTSTGENTAFGTPLPNETMLHVEGTDTAEHELVEESEVSAAMQVVLVPSELVVGPNRMAVGLLTPEGGAIEEATVHFVYYMLGEDDSATLESEVEAERLQTPDGLATIFAHEREFERAGNWGIEVQARFPDGTAAIERVGFTVLPETASIATGEQAPQVETPTLDDVEGNLARLTSAAVPNATFYDLSLDEALASGKPTVLLFATPAFCETRFCGPDYEIVSELQTEYGDAFNFIHVEIYTGLPDPSVNDYETAPSLAAFGLSTEPWLYLIDSDGTVAYRVEGMFTEAEIERQLQALVRPS